MVRKGENKISMLNLKLFRKKTFHASKKTDLWTSESEFDAAWKKRIELMASYINISGRVADFGCGMMWLEQYLGSNNSYLPIDYIRRDDKTLVVDFNLERLPRIPADIGFFSGILEYVKDLPAFLKQIKDNEFKLIIMSYCTIEKFGDLKVRASLNWVSHLSIFDILSCLMDRYDLTDIDDMQNNSIFVFHRKIK